MTVNREGAASPVSETLEAQARTLQNAVRETIRTSPDSFLKTPGDVEAKGLDYWIHEIQSSTWVLAERDGLVVGVAAAKPPEGGDEESAVDSRYIESVWIAPALRGHQLAERLISYLMKAEFRKNPDIRRFLLWVFDTNSSAINLYKRMEFIQTPDRHEGLRTEIKYRLSVNSETRLAICETMGKVALLNDSQQYGVTYRVLGKGDSA